MRNKSFLLDAQTWDLKLDKNGNIAIADNPLSVAQDVACACLTFSGECWYDTGIGIPYYERILGHQPGIQMINAKMEQEAKRLPYVSSAVCSVTIKNRIVSGVIVVTDTNSELSGVALNG